MALLLGSSIFRRKDWKHSTIDVDAGQRDLENRCREMIQQCRDTGTPYKRHWVVFDIVYRRLPEGQKQKKRYTGSITREEQNRRVSIWGKAYRIRMKSDPATLLILQQKDREKRVRRMEKLRADPVRWAEYRLMKNELNRKWKEAKKWA